MIYNLDYYSLPYVPLYTQIDIDRYQGQVWPARYEEDDHYMFAFSTYGNYTMDIILTVPLFRNTDRLVEAGLSSELPEGHYLYLFKNGSNSPERIWYRLDDQTGIHPIPIPDDTSGAYYRTLKGLVVRAPDDVNYEVPEIGQYYEIIPSQDKCNLPSVRKGYVNYYNIWNEGVSYYTPTEPGTYLVFVPEGTSNLTNKYILAEDTYIDSGSQHYTRSDIIVQRIS